MRRPTRKQALAVIFTAGAEGDQKTFLRVYVENRISLAVAREEYARGQRFGRFIAVTEDGTIREGY